MFPREPGHRPNQTSRQKAASCSGHSTELGCSLPHLPTAQGPDWPLPNLSGYPARPAVRAKLERAPRGPSSCSPASGKPEALPCPEQGVLLGWQRAHGRATFSPPERTQASVGGAPAQQGSHRQGGWAWRGRDRSGGTRGGKGEGDGPSGQHGSGQTQGLSREVAGGAGVPVLGREARLLRYPHQPRTRDPRALGLRKQVGHAAHVPGAKRHLATLHHPRGTEAQAADPPSTPPGSARPVNVPPGDCTSVTAPGPSQGAQPGCACSSLPGKGRLHGEEQGCAPLDGGGGRGGAGELAGRASQS